MRIESRWLTADRLRSKEALRAELSELLPEVGDNKQSVESEFKKYVGWARTKDFGFYISSIVQIT